MGAKEPVSFLTVKIQLESSPYGGRAGFLAYFHKALSCLPFYANSRRFLGKSWTRTARLFPWLWRIFLYKGIPAQ